jgi:crotonobetainyl-CoA:carnitine CoA-transferase CaiB-like acyl-CoA transferase
MVDMKALDGIKVIDLSRILSGPFCTMSLADMGAEVIKIETPSGDDTRAWGPPFINEESAYFLSVNRNKKSIALNLKTELGKKVLLRLVETADVVVENFRPGTLDRLGLGYEKLKEVNPRIILASISGFGQTGPYAKKPGYDVIAQGMGGLMGVTGEPGRAPVKVGYSIADVGAGMWAAFGIMNALWARQRTGVGQWVDASLIETMISWQTYIAGNYFASNENPKPMGGAHPNIVPYQVFEASDGYFNLAVGNDSLWKTFCTAMELTELIDHPDYATNSKRIENRDKLIPYLEEIFKKKTVKDWVDLMDKVQVPAGPVYTIAEVYQDPHVLAREMLVEVDHPTAGKVKMTGIPVKLSGTPGTIETPPPLLGEHTEEILTGLGYNEEQIKILVENKVINEISSKSIREAK